MTVSVRVEWLERLLEFLENADIGLDYPRVTKRMF